MDWAYVLVVILSIFLAVFLLLGIVLLILLIRVSLRIKSVTESAQRTADSIEGFVKGTRRFGGSATIAKMIYKQAKKFGKRKE